MRASRPVPGLPIWRPKNVVPNSKAGQVIRTLIQGRSGSRVKEQIPILRNRVRRTRLRLLTDCSSIIRFAILVGFVSLSPVVDLERVYGQVPSVEDLKHGVVKITSREGTQKRVGTGVIVGIKGNVAYIATASHVIEGDPAPQVNFYRDAHPYPATIQGMEGGNAKGLAGLVVEGKLPAGIRSIPFHVDPKFMGGEKVTVIGFPRMVPVPWAVTEGTITGEAGLDLIFTGAVEEGNSGGPLLEQGRVVGIVTDILGSYKYAKPAVIAKYALQKWQLVFTDAHSSLIPGQMNPVPAGMVLIPEGTFQMGSPDGEGDNDEHPQHAVTLKAFYLDTHEVTNRQFQQFVQANNYQTKAGKDGKARGYIQGEWKEISGASWLKPEGEQSVFVSGRESHPVVSISWNDANAYCTGLGKRLPTEAEWEYAARADSTTFYWWGKKIPRSSNLVANLADKAAKEKFRWSYAIDSYDDGYARTAPVGSFQANPWGLYDMSGNVWEWVADWYAENYYQTSPRKNPKGPSSGDYRALRGGSWSSQPVGLRSADRGRNGPTYRVANIGVRCAQDAP